MNMPVKVKNNFEPEIKSKLSETSEYEFGVESTTSRFLSMSLSNSPKKHASSTPSMSPSSQLTIALSANNNKSKTTTKPETCSLLASSQSANQLTTATVTEKDSQDSSHTLEIAKSIPSNTISTIATISTTRLCCSASPTIKTSLENKLKPLFASSSSKSPTTTIVTNSREQIDSNFNQMYNVASLSIEDISNTQNYDRGKDKDKDDYNDLAYVKKVDEKEIIDNSKKNAHISFNDECISDGNSNETDTADGCERIDETRTIGCHHYKRHCMFVTPCCGKFYKCRFCHDENEEHHFDRKTLTELICSECDTRQRVQETCENCGVRFGKYTCLICNLFDDEAKSQYHCYGCGICRIGGRKNFFHCEVCNMCLPIQLKIEGHRCVENISRSNCPVCLGDIHTSRIPCHIPDCGHLLHKMCFDQLLASGHYVCPTCQTSIIDMTKMWEYLDAQALIMPVPKIYENRYLNIFCNDCHKTSTVKFHFIGLKCFYCGGYNTTQDVKRRRSWVTVSDNASSA